MWLKLIKKNKNKKLTPKIIFLSFLFIFLTAFFWFARLWHFQQLMTFHLDQALFMREVREMVVDHQWRLVGPMVISKIVLGRGFFIGPALYYFLSLLVVVFHWDVVLITKFLISVWWLAAFGTLIWLGRRFSWLAALGVYAVFAALPFFIDYSRLMWNPNFLPLIGLGFFWLLEEIWRKEKLWQWFFLGFFLGLGVNFHYVAFLWGVIFFFFLVLGLWRHRYQFYKLGLLLFVLGAIVGDLPIVIFELRNNFYNVKTIFFFIQHSLLEGEGGNSFGGYFLFSLVPAFFWLLAYLLHWLEKKFGFVKTTVLILMIFLILAFNINWQQKWGTGMPEGWNIEKQRLVAREICQDVKEEKTDGNFEVATTISGDTRAGDLRWWLSQEGCTPLGVEDYPKSNTLYLIAPQERTPEKETVWEVSVLRPFFIIEEKSLGDRIVFYKLVRKD